MLDFQVQVNEIQSLRYLKHHTLDIGQYSRLQMQFSTAFNLCKSTIFFEKKSLYKFYFMQIYHIFPLTGALHLNINLGSKVVLNPP